MRGAILVIVILLWLQDLNGKEVIGDIRYEIEDVKHDLHKRDVSDIWNSIKNMANHAWEYIKTLGNNSKKKLADWIAKVKVKAQDIGKAFEERLNKMKDHVNEVIKKVMGTGDIIQKCLQERKEEINEILKNILFEVTNCITNSTSYLNNLPVIEYATDVNQTEFLKVVQNDANVCLRKFKKDDEMESCIQNIRKNIYNKMDMTEDYILRNHTDTRGATDDLLNTILGCTTDGIIKSTTIIANETVQIIECVSKG